MAATIQTKLAEIERGMRVLDLGCGPLGNCLEAARRVGSSGVVIGVNDSMAVLDLTWQMAQDEGLKNLYLVQYDPRAFVLDEPVDVVLGG